MRAGELDANLFRAECTSFHRIWLERERHVWSGVPKKKPNGPSMVRFSHRHRFRS